MKKNVIVFGLISGAVVSGLMLLFTMMFAKEQDFENGMLLGYASMLLSFSFVFVGIKNYRDKHNNGLITLGKAFKVGLFITLISSTMYVITWAFEYNFLIPDFMDSYAAHMAAEAQKAGATPEMMAAQLAEMEGYKEMYKNPVFFALLTYMEILPVGLLITLISALILKKKVK